MVTIILTCLLGAIISIIIGWDYSDDFFEYVSNAAVAVVLGLVPGLVLALVLSMNTEIKSYEENIVSLQDNSSVSGSFFLGSGDINGTMSYVFYQEVEGGFKLRRVDYKNAVIKYSDTPKVVTYKEVPTNDMINWFAIDILAEDTYEIFVPEGTIKNNFNLDAQ